MSLRVRVKRGGLTYLIASSLLAGGLLNAAQAPRPVWDSSPTDPLPAGVQHLTFSSRAANTAVSYNVLLPASYSTDQRRYPVIYWLHGMGSNENRLATTVAPRILSSLGRGALPAIHVFVNGTAFSFYADSADGKIPAEAVLISELIPHVDATYRTMPGRNGRAITGMSMGGYAAIVHGLKHSDLFSSVVAYAPALVDVGEGADGVLTLQPPGGTGTVAPPAGLTDAAKLVFQQVFGGKRELFERHSPWMLLPANADRLRDRLPIRIVVGTADGLLIANRLFVKLMQDNRYPVEFETIDGAAHELAPLYAAAGDKGLAFHAKAGGWR